MMTNCNLVLSGGGARGYAHIGAVQALREKGIGYQAISATSSGAMVGAFLCDGFAPEEIREILERQKPKLRFNWIRMRDSLLSFASYAALLKQNLRSKNIEDLQKPLFISLTDMQDGQQKIMQQGNLVEVLTAASALPAFFPPVKIKGIPYADGGMSSNLPVEPFIDSAEKLIGIHVNPVARYNESPGLRLSIDRAMHIIVRNNILPAIARCDLFIEPGCLLKYHVFEAEKAGEIIDCGYNYVNQKVDLSGLLP